MVLRVKNVMKPILAEVQREAEEALAKVGPKVIDRTDFVTSIAIYFGHFAKAIAAGNGSSSRAAAISIAAIAVAAVRWIDTLAATREKEKKSNG